MNALRTFRLAALFLAASFLAVTTIGPADAAKPKKPSCKKDRKGCIPAEFSAKLKRKGATVGKVSFKIKTNKKGVATKVTSVKVEMETGCLDLSVPGHIVPGPKVTAEFPGSHRITTRIHTAGFPISTFETPRIQDKNGFGVSVYGRTRGRVETGKGRNGWVTGSSHADRYGGSAPCVGSYGYRGKVKYVRRPGSGGR